MTTSSLSGVTVLSTRSADADPEFERLLRERGARLLFLPSVEFVEPSSWAPVDKALRELIRYDGIVFTSRNAVDFFLRRLSARGMIAEEVMQTLRIYSVGEKTAGVLRSAGIAVDVVPAKFSADGLSSVMKESEVRGRRFLFPGSSIARETIPSHIRAMGGMVDAVVVYENRLPESTDAEPVRRELLAGRVSIVTFFSPSAVKNTISLAGADAIASSSIAVIGETTARAVKDAGLPVHVIAPRASADGMVDGLEKFLSNAHTSSTHEH